LSTKYRFSKSIYLQLSMCLLLFTGVTLAQENKEAEHKPKIRGAIMMANSRVPKSFEGNKKIAIIPTWGVDVDYFFHRRWSVAMQTDIMLQDFEVKVEDLELERNMPVALVGVLHYHALRHWSFYLGPGVELEQSENLFLVRAGTEYSFEITEDFEIALNLLYENKDELYDTWTFGIAFNKKLWEKK
jgi:hypothetical protein